MWSSLLAEKVPKKAKELSALQVRRLKRPGLHAVGGVAGLHLQVKDSGAHSWILRVQIGDRRRDVGLGGFPDVTLGAARDNARQIREQIRQGIDPIAARKAAQDALRSAEAKRFTFNQASAACYKAKAREFRNSKHSAQWKGTLDTYASPVIGSLPVDQVELAHVVKVLERLWETKTETASRVRGRIESVLSWATVSGYRSGDNPARWKGNLEHIFPKPSKVRRVNHHAALPWQEIGAFMAELSKREGMAARTLEFAILTAARSGEVRHAMWDEIDLDAKLWTVPAERMKAGKQHVVPLSAAALRLLKCLPRMKGSAFVFPAPRGGALSDMSLSAVTRRMEVDAVPHGFRSSFRDWCAESTNYPREVAEQALAHTLESKVEAAYRRGDLLPKRRRLMEQWGRFCSSPQTDARVRPIRASK